MTPTQPRRVAGGTVIVLGAGMVGTCTALHLAMRGRSVVLVDRSAPGRETSYGNAGLIQREAVLPYAFPRGFGQVLRVALKRGATVNYHLSALPAIAGTLARYWRHSGPDRYPAIAQAHARLIEHATSAHAPLIAAAGAEDLVRRQGYLHVYRDAASLDRGLVRATALALSHGVRHSALDADALSVTEPALHLRLAGAIHWLDAWSVCDPGALVSQYAALFQRLGGTLVQGDAATLTAQSAGWSVQTDVGRLDAEQAVITLGPWSDGVLRRLGYRLPLFVKRGYHRHYRGGAGPNLPWYDADRGLMIASMRQGVRVTTGAEFARRDAPSTPWQLTHAERAARELLDLGQPMEDRPWLGARPCTADMKPVIGRAPGHRGLWLNIGHAHQGFTLGPICGRVLAELVDGVPPAVDPTPYAIERFL